MDEVNLVTRLIAAVSVTILDKQGDGLYERPEDSYSPSMEEDRKVFAMSTEERGLVITKEILAKRWGIGLDTAHWTLMATMQVGIRRVLHPIKRHYKTRQSHLHYPMLNTHFYTNTMFSTMKSLKGNKCAQVFTNGMGYDLIYPLKKESDASEALTEVIRSIGIPKELVSDGARAETQGEFGKIVKEYKIKPRTTEPYSGWQNRAEAAIQEIREVSRRLCYGLEPPSTFGTTVVNGLQP